MTRPALSFLRRTRRHGCVYWVSVGCAALVLTVAIAWIASVASDLDYQAVELSNEDDHRRAKGFSLPFPADVTIEWRGIGIIERRVFLNCEPGGVFLDHGEDLVAALRDSVESGMREFVSELRGLATDVVVVACVDAGWPMVCLKGERLMIPPPITGDAVLSKHRRPLVSYGVAPPDGEWATSYRWAGGTRSTRGKNSTYGDPGRVIPLRPVWFGALANTIFFMCAIHLCVCTFLNMRERIWMVKGRCRCCGYLLTGTRQQRCPECGGARC